MLGAFLLRIMRPATESRGLLHLNAVILEDDCVEVMRSMDEASVDAIVCDPPYGLEFMGKEWDRLGATASAFGESLDETGKVDYHGKGNAPFGGGGQRIRYRTNARHMQAWHEAWAREAFRVLKPGGHMLAFSGTRTYHRLACAVEDAGFEIRDMVEWFYGSGFPKSLNVGKAIDKMAGAGREVVGSYQHPEGGERTATAGRPELYGEYKGIEGWHTPITAPATDEAKQWDGWGSALKPAHEPIVLARKPLVESSIARQVLSTGTGALNVDGCRVDAPGGLTSGGSCKGESALPMNKVYGKGEDRPRSREHTSGRFPVNLIFSHRPDCNGECVDSCPVGELDRQSGTLKSGGYPPSGGQRSQVATYGKPNERGDQRFGANEGGASRFFYVAKASRRERNAGLEGMPEKPSGHKGNEVCVKCEPQKVSGSPCKCATPEFVEKAAIPRANFHPTVKPIALMRYLCRLITPPDGTILDPFAGSGSTGCAAVLEGFGFIGIEREAEYAEIARRRIDHWHAEADRAASKAAEVLF